MKKKSYDRHMYKKYRRFLSALINETRFDIIESLKNGNKNVKQLTRELKYEQSRISHNLNILERNGFLLRRREGKKLIYSVDKEVKNMLSKFENFMKKYKINIYKLKGGERK